MDRKNSIDLQEYRFYARYAGATPTPDQIIKDANARKKMLDRFTYQRIINQAKSLKSSAPAAVTTPAPRPFLAPASLTTGAAAAGDIPPTSGIDPIWILAGAAAIAWTFLRR